MALITDDLGNRVRQFSIPRHRPIALGGLGDGDHGALVRRIARFHRRQCGRDLAIVAAVLDCEDVPAVGFPLLHQIVAGELLGDHPAQQHIVDAGIVVGQDDAQPFSHLQRQRLGLQFLRMAFGHGELAFQGDDLGRVGGARDIPESGLARRRGHADARRPAVDVIGDVDAFGMARQGLDAARLGLGKQGIAGQAVVLQQRLERSGATAEAQRINGQDRNFRIDRITLVAGLLELALQRLPQDHVKRVAGGHAVARRHHELVAEGVFGAAIVIAQAAALRPQQVRCNIERGVGERSAEMPGLGIVAQQHQGHAGHKAHIFQPPAFFAFHQPNPLFLSLPAVWQKIRQRKMRPNISVTRPW